MLVESIHEGFVKNRRVEVLARQLAEQLPSSATLLDIGSGDGQMAAAVLKHRPGLEIKGIDTLVREVTAIPVSSFNGKTINLPDRSVDFAMFVDVLHHTEDPHVLLKEAGRVVRQGVLIKDHFRQGWGAGWTLRFMDRVGNRRFGVELPHNYWAPGQWEKAWNELGWSKVSLVTKLPLYPFPASLLFGRNLHFIAHLRKTD